MGRGKGLASPSWQGRRMLLLAFPCPVHPPSDLGAPTCPCPARPLPAPQMKISSPFSRPWPQAPQLSALARFPDGTPIPYIAYNELALPPSLELCRSSSSLAAMTDAFNSFSQLPSAWPVHLLTGSG